MANNFDKVKKFLGIKGAEDVKIGEGMAEKAKDTISLEREYKESALAAAVSGNPHPDFEDWLKSKNRK